MKGLHNILFGTVLSFALPLGAQNLVPNYDFSLLNAPCIKDSIVNETDLFYKWFGEAFMAPGLYEGNFMELIHECKKISNSPSWWTTISPGTTILSRDFYNCDTFPWITFPRPVKGSGYALLQLVDTVRITGRFDSLKSNCGLKPSQISGVFRTPSPKSLLQIKMKDALKPGKHVIEYYIRPVRMARTYILAIDQFGFQLSVDTFKVQNIGLSTFNATGFYNKIIYKDKWHRVVQSFIASGGERFLTLGNFKTFKETNFYNMGCDTPCTNMYQSGSFIPTPAHYYDAVMLYRPEDTVFSAFLPANGRFCPGEAVTLTAQDTGFKLTEPVKSYRWNTGDTTQSITVDSAGTYTVTVWYDDRWWDTASFTYRLYSKYSSGLPDTVQGCPESNVTLQANPAASTQKLKWSTGSTGTSLRLKPPQTVTLTAITPCDTVQDTIVVTGNACPPETDAPEFAVPDAFTPNGDGLNDTWDIYNLPEDNEVWILSRWGEVVYHQENYQGNWNGTNAQGQPLPTGVYVYKIVYYWAGKSFRDVKQGHLTLLRR